MTSDELKLVFASNLIRLRQAAGLTQAGLAEKINYSDKSISKWERGEAIPDAFVLTQMAALFGVSVDSMLTEDSFTPVTGRGGRVDFSPHYVMLTCIASICTLCLLEFVMVWMIVDRFHWAVLFSAVPLSLIAVLIMNSVWYQGKHNSYIIGASVAALILLANLIAVHFKYSLWQLLLVIIPAEGIVFLACKIRTKGYKSKRKHKQ